jgi:DNA-binding transcriptional MerR regulator
MVGFRTPKVAKLTGINAKTLHYWAVSGFLTPSLSQAHGRGSHRLYSFRDLIALRVAKQLRQGGVPLQPLRRVVEYLRRQKGLEQPLGEAFLVTDGVDVYTKTGDTLVSILRQPRQGLLFHVLDLTRLVAALYQAQNELEEPPSGKQQPDEKPRTPRVC